MGDLANLHAEDHSLRAHLAQLRTELERVILTSQN
jgi:hypothetical protein